MGVWGSPRRQLERERREGKRERIRKARGSWNQGKTKARPSILGPALAECRRELGKTAKKREEGQRRRGTREEGRRRCVARVAPSP